MQWAGAFADRLQSDDSQHSRTRRARTAAKGEGAVNNRAGVVVYVGSQRNGSPTGDHHQAPQLSGLHMHDGWIIGHVELKATEVFGAVDPYLHIEDIIEGDL